MHPQISAVISKVSPYTPKPNEVAQDNADQADSAVTFGVVKTAVSVTANMTTTADIQ